MEDYELLAKADAATELARQELNVLFAFNDEHWRADANQAPKLHQIQKYLQTATAAVMQLNERARGVRPPKVG